MKNRLNKYEKETVLLHIQNCDPVIICTYDPGPRGLLREFGTGYFTRKNARLLLTNGL